MAKPMTVPAPTTPERWRGYILKCKRKSFSILLLPGRWSVWEPPITKNFLCSIRSGYRISRLTAMTPHFLKESTN